MLGASASLILIQRQEHGEARAGSMWLIAAAEAQAAVLFADKLLGNPQSQAGTFALFGGEQRFKHFVLVLLRNARAIVGKENPHAADCLGAAYVSLFPHVART